MDNLLPLTPLEQSIHDELAGCLTVIPDRIRRPLRIYAIASAEWEDLRSQLAKKPTGEKYKLIQLLGFVFAQSEKSRDRVEAEIDRQRAAAATTAGDADAKAKKSAKPIHKIYDAG